MTRPKRQAKVITDKPAPRVGRVDVRPLEGPMRVAKGLSAALAVVGLVMATMGVGVAVGRITEGWGFPMSAVPNWGRPWGAVLMVAGAIYVLGPIVLLVRPRKGSIVMMTVAGLSVLVGTPLISTTAEIVYNLFQQTKSRPDWVDSIWAYFIILNIAICVALYRAFPEPETNPKTEGRAVV